MRCDDFETIFERCARVCSEPYLLLSSLLVLATLPAQFPRAEAQQLNSASSAKVEGVRRDAHGFTLDTGHGSTTIEIWNDSTIRVLHRAAEAPPQAPSLTVIASPMEITWSFTETPEELVASTKYVQVHVTRRTGSVRFLDPQDHSILREREDGTWLSATTLGRSLTTTEAGQKFILEPQEGIYGLGQHPELTKLDCVGSSVRLQQQNTQVAVPVLLSSKGYAVLWDNPAITNVDVGKTDRTTLSWSSEASTGVDYYFFYGPAPDKAIAGYRWLTGAAPLFPRWSWGFWQSRERYKSQQEILDIAGEYRKRKIPLDGIIQDWQYWPPLNQETASGGWGSHEFDPARYPDPAGMIRALHEENVHLMVVSWAKFDVTQKGVSIENLRQLEAVQGVYNPAIPYVYPKGQGKWYDPFNDRARSIYWQQLSRKLFSLGVDAWWLDASEAELSGNWGEFRDFKTALGPGASVFNAYPLEHTRTIYEGQRSSDSTKRVFILTRSAYAGQQRNGAVTWSGDIAGTWNVLQHQIPAGLNFVASGVPYWNTDIGGFFGSHPDKPEYVELFTRWFEWGAFTPMFRVHGTDKPKEVWRFDPATQKTLVDSLHLRYHLLPYIYSVSWQVTHNGYTMMRPLVMDFSSDRQAMAVSNQFLFGPSLLVNPVDQSGVTTRPVYLPKGQKWIDFRTGKTFDGGTTIEAAAPIQAIPLFVRAGSILPYGPQVEYANEKLDAPLELRVYPGADGTFTLYEDAGDGYAYEHGAYATIQLDWHERTQTLSLGERKGTFPEMLKQRVFHVVWVRPGHGTGVESTEGADRVVTYMGHGISVRMVR